MIQATGLWRRLGVLVAVFTPFLLVVAFYTQQKLLLCRSEPVTDTEPTLDETTPLLRAGQQTSDAAIAGPSRVRDAHQEPPTPSRGRALIIWTVFTAFLDVFAYLTVPNIARSHWQRTCNNSFECTIEWLYRIYLAMAACLPLMAKMQIFIYSHLLRRPDFQERAEALRMLTRQAMLDGIFLPPLLALWTSVVYTEMGLGYQLHLFWIFVPLYMAQALVWAQIFRQSMNESKGQHLALLSLDVN